MKTGDIVKVWWDLEDDFEFTVIREDRGFYILQDTSGKNMVCRESSLCKVEIISGSK